MAKKDETQPVERTATEGTPPVVGNEGGVIEQGTGDFAPDATAPSTDQANTVKVADRDGREIAVPVGVDGENPVSPDNPNPKAVLAGAVESDIAAAQRQRAEQGGNDTAVGRSEGTSGDRT